MTALIIIACVVLVTAFLLTRYAGVIVRYSDDLSLVITYGILRFKPEKKPKKPKAAKKKKHKKEVETAVPPDPDAEKARKREKREALFTLARKIRDILPKFFGKVHFKSAKLYAKIATGDAASTALACGGAKAAASLIFETVDNFAVLDRGSTKNVAIEPDFLSDETTLDVDLRFRIRVIYALRYGFKILIEFIKTKIKQDAKIARKEK